MPVVVVQWAEVEDVFACLDCLSAWARWALVSNEARVEFAHRVEGAYPMLPLRLDLHRVLSAKG